MEPNIRYAERKKPVWDVSRPIKVVLLSGPTAVGKSKLAVLLAKEVKGEVVSCDSMQVYKGMDIGTAKTTLGDMDGIPHYMIDLRDVSEPMTVVDFYRQAMEAVEHIARKGKIPIVVGGAGFYMRTLLYGPPKGPPSNPLVRTRIEDEMEKFGPEMLYAKLRAIDPDYAETITVQDKQKIIRSLEIIAIENKKVSEIPKPSQEDVPSHIDFKCYFVYYPKEILYSLIDTRCDEMLRRGLLEEVKHLRKEGLEYNVSASRAIAYRQAIDYLDSPQSPEDYRLFVERFKKASRNYAKRQFTWFKKEPHFQWIELDRKAPSLLIDRIKYDLVK